MRLITQLSTLLEETRPWYEEALAAEDLEDLEGLLKLFGGGGGMSNVERGEAHFNALQQLYKALEQRGLGDQFLTHIIDDWGQEENALSVVLDIIGGAYKPNKTLLYKYIIPEAIDALSNLTYKDGKYILELEHGEEANFFGDSGYHGGVDCRHIAEEIWREEGLSWEPYDTNPELDYLLENEMTEKNIEAVRQHLESEYTNAEVSSFREEFDGWKEEDQIGEDKDAFFLYPERVRRLDPYNLAVLLDSADELDDVKNEIKWAWGEAWNQGIMDNYYTTYHDDFYENVGGFMGTGTVKKVVWNASEARYIPTKVERVFYDVTPNAERILLEYIDSAGGINDTDFGEIMRVSDSTFPLCPHVDEYPHDDYEVTELFNERLQDYL